MSHVRIAAPAIVYQLETIQVHECVNMAATEKFTDLVSGARHELNTNLETNNFATTVVGTISYEGNHSYCEGMQASLNGHKKDSLLTKEYLEVTMRKVTIQEDFDSGDLVVLFQHSSGTNRE